MCRTLFEVIEDPGGVKNKKLNKQAQKTDPSVKQAQKTDPFVKQERESWKREAKTKLHNSCMRVLSK